jgi:hypothetical protein
MNEFENALVLQAPRGLLLGIVREIKPSRAGMESMRQLAERGLLNGARSKLDLDELQQDVELFEDKARARNYLADTNDRFKAVATFQHLGRYDQLLMPSPGSQVVEKTAYSWEPSARLRDFVLQQSLYHPEWLQGELPPFGLRLPEGGSSPWNAN